MAHSQVHARSSARRFGGQPEDYQELHDLFDSSKAAYPDQRHRAMFHHSFGIFVAERILGAEEEVRQLATLIEQLLELVDPHAVPDNGLVELVETAKKRIKNLGQVRTITRRSDGVQVPIRLLGEQHVVEDQGYIPTMEDWFKNLERQGWMFKAATPLSKILENFEKAEAETPQEVVRD